MSFDPNYVYLADKTSVNLTKKRTAWQFQCIGHDLMPYAYRWLVHPCSLRFLTHKRLYRGNLTSIVYTSWYEYRPLWEPYGYQINFCGMKSGPGKQISDHRGLV